MSVVINYSCLQNVNVWVQLLFVHISEPLVLSHSLGTILQLTVSIKTHMSIIYPENVNAVSIGDKICCQIIYSSKAQAFQCITYWVFYSGQFGFVPVSAYVTR